jgi:hypothetical protein
MWHHFPKDSIVFFHNGSFSVLRTFSYTAAGKKERRIAAVQIPLTNTE